MQQKASRPFLVSTLFATAIWVTAPTTIRAAEFIVLDEVLSQQTTLNAVSGDGSMVVGSVWPGPTAMVWTHDGGIMGLPGGIRAAVDVNFDGTLVVGDSISDADLVRWENGVLLPPLGLPGALENPSSQRINSDGTVITLAARPDGTDENEILRWTQDVGFTSLTGPPGGAAINRPNAISADGSVIVGYAHGFGAMRWTETTGIVGLGGSEANGVSADGSIVAGHWVQMASI